MNVFLGVSTRRLFDKKHGRVFKGHKETARERLAQAEATVALKGSWE